MRFFNAGVEVALDGSPVPPAVATSSPPTRPARFSAGRLCFPADKNDSSAKDGDDAPFGVTGSGEVCGLPSFSARGVPGGGEQPPSTRSEKWAEGLPPDAHIDPFAPNRCGVVVQLFPS